MIQAFLSHSRADKDRYVRVVADKLGPGHAVYDEYTFEAGMRPIEEIVRGLDASQVFVAFLSEAALESSWVQKELLLAQEKLAAQQLARVFPIIIDAALTHADPRIPQWMRDDYNLKYVARPTVAARRIRQRLREVSWMRNPRLRERDAIFVGRNDLIGEIETRVDDVDQELPTCFIASGLPGIGRSAVLRHGLVKCSVVRQSYEFPVIVLRREESLEDVLLKLYDLGFSGVDYPRDLMDRSLDDRLATAERLVEDIQAVHEMIVVRDEGCIVSYTCEIQPWFDEVLRRVATRQNPTFLISSRYRPRPDLLRAKPYVFALAVPELTHTERRGLFRRLAEFEELSLTRDDYAFFSDLFYGYPDQITFACQLIRDLGMQGARKEAHQLTQFNSDKAAILLAKYSGQGKALDFLYLLSEFEFISLDFLFSVVSEPEHSGLLTEFLAGCICDYVGVEKEFVRLNDVIRDYARRNRVEIPPHFRERLEAHLTQFLASSDEEDRDVSDVLYSVKEGIKAGKAVPERYLIPSHFLRSMQELYHERGHLDRVIELADRLLTKEHLLDATVAQNVRYYLCLSLARKRDNRMLREVQHIQGPEHHFLLGFYYRLQGRSGDAISSLNKCLEVPTVANRAKREVVQVYHSIEDYDSASALAKVNYEENRKNPFHIQAYFNTVVNSGRARESKELLERLLGELEAVGSDLAKQMFDIARADFLAKCEVDFSAAYDAIDDAVDKHPDSHYPLLGKAYLAVRNHDLPRAKSAYEKLEVMSKDRPISGASLARLKSYIIAMEGDIEAASELARRRFAKWPAYSRDAFLARLREVYDQSHAKPREDN